ncbi:MAG: T9SS type A sorting domain-containing protein [Vicingaceae bacterium]|nr:T9SS type A sorting domain-containing protein [Vicingaceae bacterium]
MKTLKPIFIFLIFSGITVKATSQTYHPFPDSSAIWGINECFDESPFCGFLCDDPYCVSHSVFIAGDTAINGNTYHKIYRGDIFATDTLSQNYIGAIREVNKKVYLHLSPSPTINFNFCRLVNNPTDTSVLNKDLLLYDFDVSVGDTVFYDYLDSTKIEITQIDSMLIQNQYRKRYYYNVVSSNFSNCNGLFWVYNYYIETIGSPLGIFGHLGMYFENHSELLCFEDTEIAYPDSLACYNAVGINEESIKENSVSVYPNPNNGSFELTIDAPFQQANITILDVTGKVITQQRITQKNTQLNLLSHPKGMYFYQLLVDGKQVTGKLIVQ